MLKKLLLSISLLTGASTAIFAADDADTAEVFHPQRVTHRYNAHLDTTGEKVRTVEKTSAYSEERIKKVITQSRWHNQYSEGTNLAAGQKGRIFLSAFPETAIKSNTVDGFRIDMEGRHTNGTKFRIQVKKKTFASVRIAPHIEYVYPSQLALLLELSAKSGKRLVLQ